MQPDCPLSQTRRNLKQFESGASYLAREEVIKRFGDKLLGRTDNTQFIMPKAEMDAVLRKAGDDLAFIEPELGIPGGSRQGQVML
jgi:hypothetical protein